jgi:hypothetical protein
VVRVDRAEETEGHPGKLRLGGCDEGIQLVGACDLGQRIDVPAVLGPELSDQGTPHRRVGLVPGCDVLLGE